LKTFGDFEFDNRRRRLRARGQPVRLSGQGIDLLCLLLERPGELITREEIERRLWPDRSVNFDHSLDVVISRLRTVLGDRGPNPRYIETVPRSGYRFTEPVTPRPEARPAKAPRQWGGRLITYAAVAILAAIMAIVFARTRYGRFVSAAAFASITDRTCPITEVPAPIPPGERLSKSRQTPNCLPRAKPRRSQESIIGLARLRSA
jgi:DNA-binding winged helix-turn-helix (wHTH) protein